MKLKGMAEAQATVRGNEGSQCRDETCQPRLPIRGDVMGFQKVLHRGFQISNNDTIQSEMSSGRGFGNAQLAHDAVLGADGVCSVS